MDRQHDHRADEHERRAPPIRSCLYILYKLYISYEAKRAGAVMLKNRTTVLLVLTQDVLDQARALAGKETTALKLPVSLQIVLRALIEVGLKRDNHPALLAHVESQAKAVRHQRSVARRAGPRGTDRRT